MKRDAIFYQIFQRFPSLLFALVENLPENIQGYRFESVEVKEPTFRIDGVFIPPKNTAVRRVYFAEFQFQHDDMLYHRFFCESLQYMYRNADIYDDWYGVVIFPSRSLEPEDTTVHEDLLEGKRVKRIYLDELGDPQGLPIGVSLIQLTTASDAQMVTQAKQLMERVEQEDTNLLDKDEIIEVITKIAVYKFSNLSREEVEAMLGVTFEESRVYKEIRTELQEQANQKVALAIRLLMEEGRTLEEIAVSLNMSIEEARDIINSQETQL